MSKKILIDYCLFTEFCDIVKRDKNIITGELQSKSVENESKTHSSKKVDKVKKLLLSGKRKKEVNYKGHKRPKTSFKIKEKPRFQQHSSSESSEDSRSSDTGSSDCDSDDAGAESDQRDSIDADVADDKRTTGEWAVYKSEFSKSG